MDDATKAKVRMVRSLCGSKWARYSGPRALAVRDYARRLNAALVLLDVDPEARELVAALSDVIAGVPD